MLERVKRNDIYYRTFFYCMDVCETTQKHIDDLFDFNEGCIKPENLHKAYQTGTSYKVTRMAYNLWNDYIEEGYEASTTPSSLFACEYANEFHQALEIRYPECFLQQENQKSSLIKSIKELKNKEQKNLSCENKNDYNER